MKFSSSVLIVLLCCICAYSQTRTTDDFYEFNGQATVKSTVTDIKNLTNSLSTSQPFYPGRGCRIINESGGTITFDLYELSPSGNYIQMEDFTQMSILDDRSKELGSLVFASSSLKAVLTAGTAQVYIVAGE